MDFQSVVSKIKCRGSNLGEVRKRWYYIFSDRPGKDQVMKNLKKNCVTAIILLCLMNLSIWAGQNAPAGIRIDLNSAAYGNQNIKQIVCPGINSEVRVDIYTINASNLDTYEFNLHYNSSYLQFLGGNEDQPVTSEVNFLKKNGGSTVGFTCTLNNGVINCTNSLIGNQTDNSPDGDGLLASLNFRCRVNCSGELAFDNIEWYDNNGNKDLCVDIGNGDLGHGEPITVTYNFPKDGWYMVSLAALPDNRSAAALFPNAVGGVLYTWDPVLGAYISAETLSPGVGYWLATLAGNVSVTGNMDNYFVREFDSAGWYMIGPISRSMHQNNLISDPADLIYTPTYGWDPVTRTYITSDSIYCQKGYWMAIGGPCTVSTKVDAIVLAKQTTAHFNPENGKFPPGPPNIDWLTGKLVELPEIYSLSQNFPNPFNSITRIQLALPHDGKINFKIYNVLGHLVRNLVSENKSAGYHLVSWDATDDFGSRVSSGIYFLQIQVNDFKQIRKTLLLQ